jgi:hypothetical protein
MADWEQEREVAAWYDRIEQVNERPPQDEPLTVAFRLVATINEARMEVKETGPTPGSSCARRTRSNTTSSSTTRARC